MLVTTPAAMTVAVALLGLAHAKPYADVSAPARPTSAFDTALDPDGWTPAPTSSPAGNDNDVLRRQAEQPRVCGLGNYDLQDIRGRYLSCLLPTDTCILNGTDHAHSCCPTSVASLGGWLNCNSFTTCLAGSAASDALRSGSRLGTAFCTGTQPFCASYSWSQTQLAGLTAYGCDSTENRLYTFGSATGSSTRASLFPSGSSGNVASSSSTGSTTTSGASSSSTPPPSSGSSSSPGASSSGAASAPSSTPTSNGAQRTSGSPASWTAISAMTALLSALQATPLARTSTASAVLLILALATLATAKPHADASSPARATSNADSAFSPDGWTPLPTSGAMPIPDHLSARQVSLSSIVQDAHVCGSRTARVPLFELEGRVVTCGDPRATCVLSSSAHALSCCASSDARGWQGCSSWSQCVQGSAAARVPRSEWRDGTVYCASLPNPFCATYTYSEYPGITAYGCQPTSDNPADVGTGADTAITTLPTDTPVPVSMLAGATTTASPFPGGYFPEFKSTTVFVSSAPGLAGESASASATSGSSSSSSGSGGSGSGGATSTPPPASSTATSSGAAAAASPGGSSAPSGSSTSSSNGAVASRSPGVFSLLGLEGLALAVPAVLLAAAA